MLGWPFPAIYYSWQNFISLLKHISWPANDKVVPTEGDDESSEGSNDDQDDDDDDDDEEEEGASENEAVALKKDQSLSKLGTRDLLKLARQDLQHDQLPKWVGTVKICGCCLGKKIFRKIGQVHDLRFKTRFQSDSVIDFQESFEIIETIWMEAFVFLPIKN